MKKILVLYNAHTHGHKTIAENIGYYLTEDGYEVRLEDVLQVQMGTLSKWGSNIHRFINQYTPGIWSFLYQSKWFTKISLPYRLKVASKNYHNAKLIIDTFKPDMVITTHTIASAIVAYLKQQNIYKGKFAIAFSDYHLHPYWLYEQADLYLVNTQEQKQEMVAKGISMGKIFVCGMILKPLISRDTAAIRKKLSIGQSEKVILVASGSFGFGIDEKLLSQLSKIENSKVLVVTGNNKSVHNRLQKLFKNSNIIPLGFYSPMDELYRIADIFLTKPGGLSVAEALHYYLPMIIDYMLPGQEVLNYRYLSRRGLVMPKPTSMEQAVRQELSNNLFRETLKNNPEVKKLFPGKDVLLTAVRTVIGE